MAANVGTPQSNGSSNSTSLQVTKTIVAGNCVEVTISSSVSGVTHGISDSVMGTTGWTQVGSGSTQGSKQTSQWRNPNHTGGASVVFTATRDGGAGRFGVVLHETSGLDTTDPLEDSATGGGTDSSAECGTVDIAASGIIFSGVGGISSDWSPTFDTDYTGTSNATGRVAQAYRIVASPLTDQAVHALGSNMEWAAVTGAYKDAAGGTTGTGAAAVPQPALAGSGSQAHPVAAGAMRVSPAMSGAGLVTHILAAGAMTLEPPRMAGAGSQTLTAAGAMSVTRPAMSGTGAQAHPVAAGAMAVTQPAMSGTGLAGVVGVGAMAIQPQMSGAGSQAVTAAGAMRVSPLMNGAGSLTYSGAGAMTVPTPSMAGIQSGLTNGSGALVVTISMAGTGSQSVAAVASMRLSPALAGTGTVTSAAAGGSTVPTPSMSGTGTVALAAAGAMRVTPVMAGTGLAGVIGSGAMQVLIAMAGDDAVAPVEVARTGKYANEHRSALADIGNARGFSKEHASALRDVGKAGV